MSPRPSPTATARRREANASSGGPAPSDARPSAAAPFHAMLERIRREVDARLARVCEERLAEAEPLGADVLALVDALRDLTMRGGKRFRPAMLFAAYHAVDDSAPDGVAFQAGAALELLQTYLL